MIEIILLKTPIFKFIGNEMPVPGLVDFEQHTASKLSWMESMLSTKLKYKLLEIRENPFQL